MPKKVRVVYLGITHYCAFCNTCDWTYQNYRDRRKGQLKIRKHVLETGHRVQLEKGTATEYSLIETKTGLSDE